MAGHLAIKNAETCRFCGTAIHFVVTSEGNGTGPRWAIFDVSGNRHSCGPRAAKIYTEEERLEFARRRQAGEV